MSRGRTARLVACRAFGDGWSDMQRGSVETNEPRREPGDLFCARTQLGTDLAKLDGDSG
jgi:hypothetical protein